MRTLWLGLALVWVQPRGSHLYGNEAYYWSGSPATVRVCWENPTAALPLRREWARDAVESNWARYARVTFSNWDTCTPGKAGVHILIKDARSFAPGGNQLNGVTNGATINLIYDTWGGAGCTSSDSARQHCIRAVVAHEFGHVLGFYHEEERPSYVEPAGTAPDTPCAKQTISNSNPRYYGAYDQGSVMSYCGQPAGDPTTWKERISPGDIAAVQRAYGRHIPGSLVSPRGNCMASHAGRPDGEAVFTWGCDEAKDDQEWRWPIGRSLMLAPDRCLQATPAAGAPAKLFGCTPASQRWMFEQVQIRGWGGLCLDLKGGSTTAGTPIQMWECGAFGGANQRWSIVGSQIRFGGPNSSNCLTVSGSSILLGACADSQAQRFSFLAGGEIRPLHVSNMCLDVRAVWDTDYLKGQGLPVNGATVQLFQCSGSQLNQKWNFSGGVRLDGTSFCLERPGNATANGTGVRLGTCAVASAAQQWDYYFK